MIIITLHHLQYHYYVQQKQNPHLHQIERPPPITHKKSPFHQQQIGNGQLKYGILIVPHGNYN